MRPHHGETRAREDVALATGGSVEAGEDACGRRARGPARRHHRGPRSLPQDQEGRRPMRAGTGNGSVYRLKNRGGELLPTWWIKYYVPGRTKPIRESAKTSDEQEARRLLHARLAEATPLRVERLARSEVTVGKLLDLVRDDYGDHGRKLPPGILDAWQAVLGAGRAGDE